MIANLFEYDGHSTSIRRRYMNTFLPTYTTTYARGTQSEEVTAVACT